MSSDPVAKLFYGYVEPIDPDDYDHFDKDEDEETPWGEAHTKRACGCIGELFGTDGNLGNALAVEASLHKAEWSHVNALSPQDFEVHSEWDEQLQQAAAHFGIDVSGLKLGWHLVSLYF